MFVCICKALTDRTIAETAIKNNARTVVEVTRACGAGGDCGSCQLKIHQILENISANSEPGNKAS